ncbi:MAG: ABC-2 family transporter protein [Polyangia bacterium]
MSALRTTRMLLRASVMTSMQYRADFFFDLFYAFAELAWTIVPMLVVFGARPSISGWSLDEALLVTAWFTFLKGVLEGLVTPSLVSTIEQLRRGTFDFVLLKPVDAQLYGTIGKLQLPSVTDLVAAVMIAVIALHRLHHHPTASQLVVAALLTLCSLCILYALNVLALCVAFFVARIDNLAYLLAAVFDAARWPASVFRGGMRVFLTFVVPLGVMTTYPPLALLGRLSAKSVGVAVGVAMAALLISRLAWLRSIAAYRSAGG